MTFEARFYDEAVEGGAMQQHNDIISVTSVRSWVSVQLDTDGVLAYHVKAGGSIETTETPDGIEVVIYG